MSNLFMYEDPTLKTTAVLNDAMRNAASIMGLKNQADYQQEHNRLLGQHYANEAVNQAAQRVNEQAKLKPSQVNFSTAHIMPYLRNIQVQKIDKHWKPVTDLLMTHVANNNMNAGAVYDDIATNFDTSYKPLMRDALIAEAQAQPDGADLGAWNKKLQALEDMTGEEAARSILPSVHNERQNERAAVEGQKSAERAAMLNPETQAYRAFYSQAKRQGMNDEDAAVAATEKFGVWKSKMNLEGKYPPINVSVNNPYTPSTMVDDQGRPLSFNKKTGRYEVQEDIKIGSKPTDKKKKGIISQALENRAGGSYKYTAKDAKGNRIGSNDGVNWTPIK